MASTPNGACFLCQGTRWSNVFVYNSPPTGETFYPFAARAYHREVWRCDTCGHYRSLHDLDEGALYQGGYVDAKYGDDGIRRAFERITALDPARSDNVGRVQRVLDFMGRRPAANGHGRPTVLDVGSGLCVFLHRMKAAGWDGIALDPDERAAAHARRRVGVRAVCADFLTVEGLDCFDLVTFNKVLEHVEDPVTMLARAARYTREGGCVYIELPDGEAAVVDGPGREEFFIDHHHVFSLASLALLATHAGFRVEMVERLREPSTKYTLFAFLTPDNERR
jgi:SAM-dependent methyltransferase